MRTALWAALALVAICLLAAISVVVSSSGIDTTTDRRGVVQIAASAIVFAVVLGILVMASESTHGTITQSLLVTPARLRVVAAKVVVAAVAGVGLGLLAEIVVLAVAAPGVDVRVGDFGGVLAAILAGCALAGALGVGVGAVFRGQGAAIAVTLVWLLVGENLAALLRDAQRFTPGRAFGALVSDDAGGSDLLLGTWGGAALALAYTALFVAAGAVALVRRDV